MIRILLAEDYKIIRKGIKLLLETDPDLQVVGEAENGHSAMELLAGGLKADVILAHINMPEMDEMSLLKEAKITYPDIRIVIFSRYDHEKYVAQAFLEGASAYLLKNVDAAELIFCLKHVSCGKTYICSEVAFKLLDQFNSNALSTPKNNPAIVFSSREMEVLAAIADGDTNAEIAKALFLSKRTIEGHRQSLLEKTGSKNTASLIRFVVQHGLLG